MIHYIIAAGIGAFLGSRSKKSKKSYAKGGELKIYVDKDDEPIKVVKGLNNAKKWVLKNKRYHDEIVVEDEALDSIVVDKTDTIKDIDWLFNPTYAHGGSIREIISNPHKPPFRIIIDKNGNEYVYRQWADNNIPYLIPYTIRNEEAYTDRQKSYFWSHHNIPKDTWIDVRSIKDFSIYPLSKKEFEELRNAKMQSNNKAYENVLEKYHNSFKKGGSTYAEGGLLRVLKDSGFNHHKGSPKNELKHNRGAYIATIGKDNMGEVVHLDKYTPNTKRFISSTSFDNPKKLADYFNKNQLYAKGGKTRKNRKK